MRQSRAVTIGRTLVFVFLAGVVFFALFDVDFVFVFALPAEVRVPDPDVETAYRSCYEDRDHEIHARAFATIDNPEVQKDYINAHRVQAAADCRSRFPEKLVTVRQPFRFDIVDVRPRFW